MKIKSVKAVEIEVAPTPRTEPRVTKQLSNGFVSPMQRYPQVSRSQWSSPWRRAACVVTAEDGNWGFGMTTHAGPVVRIIEDHFAGLIEGADCMATELMWDQMQRASAAYGTPGLTSYAISAVDNALWDLKGKILQRPVYELLGGPQKEKIFVYASNTDISYGTANSIEWFLELGFQAVKLFLREGPEAGLAGIKRSEELVGSTREQVGDDVEIAVDAWMSSNTEHVVRLSEALRPYRIKWLEDYLPPDDFDGYLRVRERVPWQILATGEHWYSLTPFALAAARGLVDIFQPDLQWVGGMTAGVKICALAQAHGITVIPHASSNYPYGQHLAFAMPSVQWAERSEGVSPPGVPLEEMVILPGTPVIENGYVKPSDAPGFGLEITREWIEERQV
ncbi:MAG: enolase C-terminal domain-like protein [Candidatus Latescibacterota bacterium]|nr:enolase C-terminal domain-like protein [Candidatus Latescibacterota bacterium]